MRHRLDLGALDFRRVEHAVTRHAVEHPVSRVLGRLVEAIRPAQLRRLRQGHEQGCLAEREPALLLAEEESEAALIPSRLPP